MRRRIDTAPDRLEQDVGPLLCGSVINNSCRQFGHPRRRDARLTPYLVVF